MANVLLLLNPIHQILESVNYSKAVRMQIKTKIHATPEKIHVISIPQQLMELIQHSASLTVAKQ